MISVLGGGAFGSALACALARGGQPVTLWARDISHHTRTGEMPRLAGVLLPDTVQVTDDLARATGGEVLLLATPMQSLRGLLGRMADPLTDRPVVLCCKGIDLESGQGPSRVLAAHKPEAVPAVLTGPSFARDIAQGLPTALTLACAAPEVGQVLQTRLSTPVLRLYRTDDVIGAELGGALKNVIAIACGAAIGAGLGHSARAALMTRGFAEMTRLALHMGAAPETLAGLSGMGDLVLTCTSEGSRNYRYGLDLGRGSRPDASQTVEGVATAQAAARIAEQAALSLPITTATAALTTGTLTVAQAMDHLLTRPLKEE